MHVDVQSIFPTPYLIAPLPLSPHNLAHLQVCEWPKQPFRQRFQLVPIQPQLAQADQTPQLLRH